jgi:aminoglycoside phosphotransferase (APT) family kinase protein
METISTLIGNPAPRFELRCTRFPDPARTRASLDQYRGRWLVDTLISISHQIAAGMATAHSAGIVHGDLKPDNVMVTAENLGSRPYSREE